MQPKPDLQLGFCVLALYAGHHPASGGSIDDISHVDAGAIGGPSAGMEWIVEFDGRQMPLDAVWSNDFAKIVGPLKSTIEKALIRAADPDELDSLQIIVFAEDDGDAPVWGFRFAGSPVAVNYAVILMGAEAPIVPATH